MHCIESLVAGIRGAENGTATLLRRGTSTAATWYPDFEASSSSTDTVDLDANGGAAVFVGELVEVSVYDADGLLVRRFTSGTAAGAVEVRSASFTGIDYTTGQSGLSKPTTLDAILDRWVTSTSSSDFNVVVASATKSLQNALAGSSLYFNVKSSEYGAVGDGATDDSSAIQAAINAASAAGGGTVFFPSGSYRHTSALSLPSSVSLLGVGPQGCALQIDHASQGSIAVSTASTYAFTQISGLRIEPLQANSGVRVACGAGRNVLLFNCYIGHASRQNGDCVNGNTSGTLLAAVDCVFVLAGSASRVLDGQQAKLVACNITFPTGAYSPTTGVVIVKDYIYASGLTFSGLPASGTYSCITISSAGSVGGISDCFFQGNPSATVTGITYSSTSEAVESGNNFSSTITPYAYTAANLVGRCLQTREHNASTQAVAGNTTIKADQYGEIVASVSVNTALVLTISAAPVGSQFVLVIDNDFAGTTGNITFDAAVRGLTTETLLSGEVDVYRFLRESVDGTPQWLLTSAQRAL